MNNIKTKTHNSSCNKERNKNNFSFIKKLLIKTKKLLNKRTNLEEELSNPIYLNEIYYRKQIKKMVEIEEILTYKERDTSLHHQHFLENNRLTKELLDKTSELLHLWNPNQPYIGLITLDYAHNIIDRQSEGYSLQLYYAAYQLEKNYQTFRNTLHELKKQLTTFCWSVLPIEVINTLHSSIEIFASYYNSFSDLFTKEVKNSIPSNLKL